MAVNIHIVIINIIILELQIFRQYYYVYNDYVYVHSHWSYKYFAPCRVGSVGSVSASCTVGREFASRPGHTKDHHKNGTNCLPTWHAMR